MFSFLTNKKRIYLDHAAATPLSPNVAAHMQPYFADVFGNPEAVYQEGKRARDAVTRARDTVAAALRVHAREVIFTAGGTEANNLAVFGIVGAARAAGTQIPHVAVSEIEHPAILSCVQKLEADGDISLSYIPVNAEGVVEAKAVAAVLRPETVLLSIMYVNNEVGAVQPITEIAKVVRKHRKQTGTDHIVFHTDATQAPLYMPIAATTLGVDAMTLDGQKMYGPKGTGVLFVRSGISIEPHMYGGAQEMGRRAGTENVPGIVGFATALADAVALQKTSVHDVARIRDVLIDEIQKRIPDAYVHGNADTRIAHTANICIPGTDAEFLVIALDEHGIAAATRSACTGRDADTSHVLRAMGVSDADAGASLRFSLSHHTSKADVRRVAHVLANTVYPLARG